VRSLLDRGDVGNLFRSRVFSRFARSSIGRCQPLILSFPFSCNSRPAGTVSTKKRFSRGSPSVTSVSPETRRWRFVSNWMKARAWLTSRGSPTNQESKLMQNIYLPTLSISAPRLLPKNRSAEWATPPETPSARLSPKMPRSTASSPMRLVGTRWLWQRQSKISRKWMETPRF
jgi:hypothetical protein